MNSKQLHKHALPVVVLSVGLAVVSAVALSHITLTAPPTGGALVRDLTGRQLSINPAVDGLFHVSRTQPTAQAAGNVMLDDSSGGSSGELGAISSAGQSTALNAALVSEPHP